MTDHVHAWSPIEGESARYGCECGVTGYRHRDGDIREHRSKPEMRRSWTAMNKLPSGGGRVLPKRGAE